VFHVSICEGLEFCLRAKPTKDPRGDVPAAVYGAFS